MFGRRVYTNRSVGLFELFFNQPSIRSLACFNCCRTMRTTSRNSWRFPPFQGLRATLALPSADLGPVERSQGFHTLISSDCRARRSGVQDVGI